MEPLEQQAEINKLVAALLEKQKEIDDAQNRDLAFIEKLKLYRELKEINSQLQNSLRRANTTPPKTN